MNKVLDLLEQYCQWLAIALGGLFLGLMVWWYLLFSPVAVVNAGKTETPATVDDDVRRNYADALDQELHREQTEQPPVQRLTAMEKWESRLGGVAEPILALRPDWPASIPQEVTLSKDTGPTTQAAQVAQLPDVPPSEIVDLKAARAFVAPPTPQPGAAVAAPAPVPAAGQPAAGKDMSYVRLEYRIAPQEIGKKFTEVKIPIQASNTSIESVVTYREEQLPDGTWTSPVQVALINSGTEIQQPPPDGSPQTVVATFRTWAESQVGQTDLLRPPFYTVLQGEGPWDPPADEMPVIDPAVEKQKRIDDYKKKLEADKQKRLQSAQQRQSQEGPPPGMGSPGGPGGPPPGMGGPGGGRRGRGGDGYVLPLQWGQARPLGYPPNMPWPPTGSRPSGPPPGFPPNMPSDMDPNGQPPQQQAAPGSGQPGANPLPAPVFRPSDTQPFVGWAYDETVIEGRTYRYQVVYAIRNPVYLSNIVAKPEMAQQFLLTSKIDEAAWSKPIVVKPSTEYFLAGAGWSSNTPSSVRLEVFKWSQGKWQSHVFTVAPGDEIGGVDAQTDFTTGATVVDVRYDSRGEQRAYLVVLAPDGKLVEHEPKPDSTSQRLAYLRNAVQTAANPNGVTPVGAPTGGPPGVPPPLNN